MDVVKDILIETSRDNANVGNSHPHAADCLGSQHIP